MTNPPDQAFLPLTHAVTTDRAHSLVCLPDRDSADAELTRLRHEYGERLLKATIRTDRPPKRNPHAKTLYTLCYHTRDTDLVALF